jgi:hypothetical protein
MAYAGLSAVQERASPSLRKAFPIVPYIVFTDSNASFEEPTPWQVHAIGSMEH